MLKCAGDEVGGLDPLRRSPGDPVGLRAGLRGPVVVELVVDFPSVGQDPADPSQPLAAVT